MTPTPKKKKQTLLQDWLKKPWSKLIGALSGISLVFGLGYSVGQFKKGLECDIEQIKLQQEFNERFQKQVNEIKESRLDKFEKNVEEIQTVIKVLEHRDNAK